MWVNFVWKAFIFSVLWARWEEGGFCYFDEGENWKWMFWLALTSLLLFGLHNNKAIGKKIVLAFQFFFVKLWENLCQAFWKGLCSFFSFVQKEAGPLSSFCCVSIRFDEKWSVNKWSLNIHILIDDALVHTTVSKRFSHSSHHSNGTPPTVTSLALTKVHNCNFNPNQLFPSSSRTPSKVQKATLLPLSLKGNPVCVHRGLSSVECNRLIWGS